MGETLGKREEQWLEEEREDQRVFQHLDAHV
jgi:hypothetical protein